MQNNTITKHLKTNKMKNLHLKITDKPSRLVLETINNNLFLTTTTEFPSKIMVFKNIYITSDEEIKEGDWFYNTISLKPEPFKVCENGNGYVNCIKYSHNRIDCKKIILTTDVDLIVDGVQTIEDDFLEWFVNNPSCEFIKVIRNKKLSGKNIFDAKEGDLVFNNHGFGGIIQELSNDIRVHIVSENGEGYMETAITADNGIDTLIINNYKVHEYTDYKIIIPQEEPYDRTYQPIILSDIDKEEPKQERMYSEEEVKEILMKTDRFLRADLDLWFEQFKKK
jgi:hypothetical protein